jgi:two-component system phosphate regulon sensor histidine kinase PhoR
MRKAIIKKFISVLLLAMGVSGFLFYITVSIAISNSTEEDMRLNLMVLDNGLNYDKPLQPQIASLPTTVNHKMARYTIIDLSGVVLADTYESRYDLSANHSDREEFIEAVNEGVGYSNRYSDTLKTPMLYTAVRSLRSDCVLRIAIPYTGYIEYLVLLLPAILLSLTVAFIVAFFSAERLAKKLTKPIHHIIDVMVGYKDDTNEISFEKTPYDELNIIADAALDMSKSVKLFTQKVEFERLIRQEFFENASHELKTPITSIRGYMELLLGGFAKDEELQHDFMNRILNETEHISTLINEILLISQLETNEIEVSQSEIRMAIILEDVIHSLQPLALENGIRIFTECKPAVIMANYKHIRELLSNLISNAIKYNKPEGEVHITVKTEATDLIIIVEDTGVGIPEEAKARVFERFYRVDKGRSRRVGGTGLGLSIVKHIVNYYEGSITLQSKVNEGSRFTCRLKCIKND